MQIDIIVAHIKRYEFGHEKDFVPPITGIHLAAITPAEHIVRVFHQQVDRIDFYTKADLIALSFFSGFAPAALDLARAFRERGKLVVARGPHVTFNIDESLDHFDAIVTGKAETAWIDLLRDLELGELKRIYSGRPSDMKHLPTPRYDLLSDKYFIRKVIQATRGCPFTCSFRTVPSLNSGFRLRPVDDVIRDAAYDNFPHWWQRKIVWFWDDNLTINRKYIHALLTGLKPLKKWWLTQASMDIALWKKAFSVRYSTMRILRGLFTLRPGAMLLSLFMNSFYMYKRIRKNYPVDMNKNPIEVQHPLASKPRHLIAHHAPKIVQCYDARF